MTMNKGLLALFLVGLVAIAGSVSAFGFFGQDTEEVRAALEDNDYSAWKAAIESQLTEENFNLMRERQSDMEERAAEMEQMREYRDAMRQAIEDNDYDAWKAAAEEMGLESEKILDEEDFALLVQLHQAREDNDTEKVAALMEEIDQAGIAGFGMGPGMELGFGPEMGESHRGMGPGHMGYGAEQLVEETSE